MHQSLLLNAVNIVITGDETQQNVQLLVLLLVITLAVALISRPLRLPYALVLVVIGLIIGFSPLLPNLRLNPDVVLFLFLPALLFEGAWNVDLKLLTTEWLPVFLLAVPGLLLSVLTVAMLLHWGLIPFQGEDDMSLCYATFWQANLPILTYHLLPERV